MDFPLAPAVKAALHAAIDRDDVGYTSARYDALRMSFSEFARRRMNWPVDPDRVVLVPEIMVGVAELLRVLLEPGDGVVINPPVYPPFFSTIEEVGNRVIEVPLDPGSGLDLDGIAAAFEAGARALLLCNPHNPTGRVPTRAVLADIADLAGQHHAWVLSDEIHAPLTLPGAEHVPFLTASRAAAECGIALTSASKAFNIAGLKAGLAVTASSAMAKRLAALPVEFHERAGLLGVLASEAAFTHGDPWLVALLETLDSNRQLVADLLAEHLPEVGYQPPQAGYLAWLDCRRLDLGPDPARVFLERGRVAVSRGLDFGPQGAGFVRLNIGTSPDIIVLAIERMVTALSDRPH